MRKGEEEEETFEGREESKIIVDRLSESIGTDLGRNVGHGIVDEIKKVFKDVDNFSSFVHLHQH